MEAGPTRSVVRVIDAETVLLDDDEEVRLIGALAPRSPDLRPDAQSWPPEQDTAAALRDLVVGRSVELATSRRAKDRYGRLLAHLFLDDNGDRVWVPGSPPEHRDTRAPTGCPTASPARKLLAHERVAHAAGIGLWANAAYATRKADDGGKLLRYRNSYQIVGGSVVRVKAAKARTYTRFRPRLAHRLLGWHRRQDSRANPEWAKTLAGLEGRKVEVRGWIEYRSGPYIAIEDPSQPAVIDESAPPSPASPAPGGRCSAASGQMGRARTSRTKETPGAQGAGRRSKAALRFRVRRPWSEHLRPRPRPQGDDPSRSSERIR